MTALLLPPGRHRMTHEQVVQRWGFSPARRGLLTDLERFLDAVETFVPISAYWISGSMLTDKPEPSDVDVIIIVDTRELYALEREARKAVTDAGFEDLAGDLDVKVHAYLLAYHYRKKPERTGKESETTYLDARGYYDDLFVRLVDYSVSKYNQPPEAGLPRRGYAEVLRHGFRSKC